MTSRSTTRPLDITPGVQPDTDRTNLATPHWTSARGIRFENGSPQKIGGYLAIDLDDTVHGTCRTIYSTLINNSLYTILGTNEKLYYLSGDEITNITPVVTSTTAIANSLDTHYATLANNPVATTNGSKFLVISDTTAARLRVGDTYTLSGASTTNGIPDTEINAAHVIRTIGANTVTIKVSSSASSTGSGGGASVVRATGLIQVSKTAHALVEKDRIKVASAATVGGVTDTQINREWEIRYVDADNFDFMTAGTATSSVAAGGGASTTYQVEIDDGDVNVTAGQGYGMGRYGTGLYGDVKISSATFSYPRIWFMDRFGDNIIGTPGNGTGLYTWDGDLAEAPVLVSGAPTAINYAFVSDSIVVTFGAGGTENRILACDQGDITNWTDAAENQVFDDDIEGAGKFISHVSARGINLIFTEKQTYTMRYIGPPLVWEIKPLDSTVGIISPMARVAVKGVTYWMGAKNFYMWRGGNVEVIPSNTGKQSTIMHYVFTNINEAQRYKIFCWYNELFDEIWWHYPSAGSNEPDRIARLDLTDMTWVPDELDDRTAAEYPSLGVNYPRMISSESDLFYHEIGLNADEEALSFSLRGPKMTGGKTPATIVSVIPDSVQSGNITVNVSCRLYPQSANASFDQDYTVSPTTENIVLGGSGRYWEYEISGEDLDQEWMMGAWQEEVQPAGGN